MLLSESVVALCKQGDLRFQALSGVYDMAGDSYKEIGQF